MNNVIWQPQPRQAVFLSCPEYEVLHGRRREFAVGRKGILKKVMLLVVVALANAIQHLTGDGVVGFVRWHNRLYAAAPDKVILMDADEEEAFRWYAETTVIHENIMETKGVYDIFLRLDTEKGSEVRVFIVRDNGETRLCGEIAGGAFRTHRVPVRFQMGDSCKIRIEGTGKCTVHGIERTVYAGGKRYR